VDVADHPHVLLAVFQSVRVVVPWLARLIPRGAETMSDPLDKVSVERVIFIQFERGYVFEDIPLEDLNSVLVREAGELHEDHVLIALEFKDTVEAVTVVLTR
jgi:hypothetical protein